MRGDVDVAAGEAGGEARSSSLRPGEQCRKLISARRKKLLALLLVEGAVCACFLAVIMHEDLPYRTVRQVENVVFGMNTLDAGVYVGDTDFGYFSGEGSFEYRTGSAYSGEWEDNRIEGLGVLRVPGEGTYEGEFNDSEKSGNGTFTWDDGARYEGGWLHDRMFGEGTYTAADGTTYSGLFEDNGFKSGLCSFENANGSYRIEFESFEVKELDAAFADGSHYRGTYDEKSKRGYGTVEYANGDVYSGDVSGGRKHGFGKYVWKNGDEYEGRWNDDSLTGEGVYTFSNGASASGTFKEGILLKGVLALSNSSGDYEFVIEDKEAVSVKMALVTGTHYSGDLKDGKLTGTAEIEYGNGDVYSGEVEGGRKNGQGAYIWSNGASYEGAWSDDAMEGRGTYRYPENEEGFMLIGSFSDGRPDGECQYSPVEGKVFKTDWVDGTCVKVYE